MKLPAASVAGSFYFYNHMLRRISIWWFMFLFAISCSGQVTGIDSLLLLANSTQFSPKERIHIAKQALNLAQKQNQAQQEINALLKLGELSLEFEDIPDATNWYYRALTRTDEAGSANDRAYALNNLGMIHYRQGSLDSAAYYFQLSIESYPSELVTLPKAQATQNLGMVFHKRGNFDQAFNYYSQAALLFEKKNASREQAICYHNMALVQQVIQEIKTALNYFQQALKVSEGIKDTQLLAAVLNSIGSCYSKTGAIDSSFYYHQKALNFYKTSGNHYQIAQGYTSLAYDYEKSDSPEMAVRFYRKALTLQRAHKYQSGEITSFLGLGRVFEKLQQYDSCAFYSSKAHKLAIGAGLKPQVTEAIELMLGSRLHANRDTQSLHLISDLLNWQDSVFGDVKMKAIAEAEKKYQVESTRQLLEIEKLEGQVKNQTIVLQRNRILYLSIGAAVLLLLILFLVYLYRQQRKSRRIIANAKDELSLLYEDATHRWGNFLMEFKAVYGREMKHAKEPEIKAVYQKGIGRIQSMILLQQMAYAYDGGSLKADQFLSHLVSLLLDIYDIKEVEKRLDIESVELTTKQGLALGLIVTELVTNAIKYGQPSDEIFRLNVVFGQHSAIFHLDVVDNGSGFESSPKEGSGLGMTLVEKRVRFLEGNLSTHSDNGTHHHIEFPIN